jgi:DNA-binding transcriptional ArsR family regulator
MTYDMGDSIDPSALDELQASAHKATRLLKLLASEQRLMLLCRLLQGECAVGDLAQAVGLSQSATSQHLAKLRAEHLVGTRRAGQTIYYVLRDPAAVKVLDTLCEIYKPATKAVKRKR